MLVGLVGMTLAGFLGTVSVLWGLALGLACGLALWTARIATSWVEVAALMGAGAIATWWFGTVLDQRTAAIDLGLSWRAALGFLLLGAATAWIVNRRSGSSPAMVLVSAVVWWLATVVALQMGTAVGYLAELRVRDISAGAVQGLGPPVYAAVGLTSGALGLGVNMSTWARRPGMIALTGSTVFTVLAFNHAGFSVADLVREVGRIGDFLGRFWPPVWRWSRVVGGDPALAIVDPMIETIQIAVVGATIGIALALPLSFLASRPTAPGAAAYWIAKGVLSVVRTVPDLFWAALFAAAVGFGAFAGALAMIVFSLVIMAKLLSETVDSIDLGPLEAADAAGASHWEKVQYAALPQVMPTYVGYGLYIFELNIRASVVIGLVGAGGIGRLLDEQRTLFQWDRVMAIVIVIFVAVIVIELVSVVARRRFV